jgi:hypothetical protein
MNAARNIRSPFLFILPALLLASCNPKENTYRSWSVYRGDASRLCPSRRGSVGNAALSREAAPVFAAPLYKRGCD